MNATFRDAWARPECEVGLARADASKLSRVRSITFRIGLAFVGRVRERRSLTVIQPNAEIEPTLICIYIDIDTYAYICVHKYEGT